MARIVGDSFTTCHESRKVAVFSNTVVVLVNLVFDYGSLLDPYLVTLLSDITLRRMCVYF